MYSHSVLKFLSTLFSALVFLTALLVLLGWHFDIEILKRPLPGTVAMNPATAIAFITSALSFLLLKRNNISSVSGITGILFAVITFLIGSVKLTGIISGTDVLIDSTLYHDKLLIEFSNQPANRMAPNTAFCFVLVAVGLLTFKTSSHRKILLPQYFALTVALVAWLSVLGYLYDVKEFYGVLHYIPMAIHTALCFLFMALSLLICYPDKGFVSEFNTPFAGSLIARMLIPAAVLVPVLLGFIRLYGYRTGLFSTELGVALLVLFITIIFLVLIWYNTRLLNRRDAAKLSFEQRLSESNEKFLKLFYNSPAAMAITELLSGKFLEVNEAYMHLTGYTQREIIGKTSIDLGLISVEYREQIRTKVLEMKSVRNIEIVIINSKKEPVPVLLAVDIIRIGKNDCMLSSLLDITGIKRAEREIKELNRELEKNIRNLEEANKELDSFSYSVSHDLRAPLRAIYGYCGILLGDFGAKVDSEMKRLLEIVSENAKKMGRLIDDLLAFSRLSKKEIVRKDIDMNEIVKNVIDEIRSQYRESNAEWKISDLTPALADPSLIKQVWLNLVSNAVKYSRHRSNPEIEIGCRRQNDEIIYFIRDNGVGFDMRYAGKLFGVFQRLHGADEFEGTGVGLAIVKRIITRHKGTVWAEAKEGEGSSFYFSLNAESPAGQNQI
ncbi:MAG: PAS domain S-box protein [Bacteroidetes bacterium]|nr:PAS domain S-box protein [Bacteroidota bacterium]